MNNDFKMHFGQIFNLKIVNLPQSINLQVRHKHVCSQYTRQGTHNTLVGFYMNECVCVCGGGTGV